jgi:hypothetical protein
VRAQSPLEGDGSGKVCPVSQQRPSPELGSEPIQLVPLLDGGRLQCETVSEFACFSDEANRSEPCLRAHSG